MSYSPWNQDKRDVSTPKKQNKSNALKDKYYDQRQIESLGDQMIDHPFLGVRDETERLVIAKYIIELGLETFQEYLDDCSCIGRSYRTRAYEHFNLTQQTQAVDPTHRLAKEKHNLLKLKEDADNLALKERLLKKQLKSQKQSQKFQQKTVKNTKSLNLLEQDRVQTTRLRDMKRKIGIHEAKEDLKKQIQKMSIQEIAQSLKIKQEVQRESQISTFVDQSELSRKDVNLPISYRKEIFQWIKEIQLDVFLKLNLEITNKKKLMGMKKRKKVQPVEIPTAILNYDYSSSEGSDDSLNQQVPQLLKVNPPATKDETDSDSFTDSEEDSISQVAAGGRLIRAIE